MKAQELAIIAKEKRRKIKQREKVFLVLNKVKFDSDKLIKTIETEIESRAKNGLIKYEYYFIREVPQKVCDKIFEHFASNGFTTTIENVLINTSNRRLILSW